SGSNINTIDFPVDSENDADSSNDFVATQNEEAKERIDYEETFSPVVKMVIVRCLLNIDVSMSWPVFQIDVNNAFLYGDLEEVIFMKPPEGYIPFDNKVYRHKKSLYGLKRAPRQWNAKLTYTLIENGFSQSKSDYSLYTNFDKGCFLSCWFMWMILSLLRKYVLDLLSEYGMLACKPAKTLLISKLVISNEASDKDPLFENIIDYQKLMGKLIYLNNTRLNISYAVDCLSQFMHSPLTSHIKIAFKILRYLKSCLGLGVHITKTSGMFLTAYSNADWAKCIVTSNSAIKIAANLIFHERTKHLEIDLHFVREKVLKGVVKSIKVDSANQIADILTKAINAGDRVDSALKDMAIVMKQQNRAEEAIEAIKSLRHRCSDQAQESLDNSLLDLYKEATRLLGNLGWALMQQNHYIEAEDAYRKALVVAPDNNKMCNLGICLMKQGRIGEAKDTLRLVKPAEMDGPRGEDSHLKAYERSQQMLRDLKSEMMNSGSDRVEQRKLFDAFLGSSAIWQPQPCKEHNVTLPPLNPRKTQDGFANENANVNIMANKSVMGDFRNSRDIGANPFNATNLVEVPPYMSEGLKRTRSGDAANLEANKIRRRSISPERIEDLTEFFPDSNEFTDAIITAVLGSSGEPGSELSPVMTITPSSHTMFAICTVLNVSALLKNLDAIYTSPMTMPVSEFQSWANSGGSPIQYLSY
nr:hypothetical protein [Tanacetum cinerariifolium]